jgi:hypothetical protein
MLPQIVKKSVQFAMKTIKEVKWLKNYSCVITLITPSASMNGLQKKRDVQCVIKMFFDLNQ